MVETSETARTGERQKPKRDFLREIEYALVHKWDLSGQENMVMQLRMR